MLWQFVDVVVAFVCILLLFLYIFVCVCVYVCGFYFIYFYSLSHVHAPHFLFVLFCCETKFGNFLLGELSQPSPSHARRECEGRRKGKMPLVNLIFYSLC